MKPAAGLDEILTVLAAAALGDYTVRVSLPEGASTDDKTAQLAIAVNLLLDDIALRATRLQAAYRSNQQELERVASERSARLREAEREVERLKKEIEDVRRKKRKGESGK